MKKSKGVKKIKSVKKKGVRRTSTLIYGLEQEFLLIAGGGVLVFFLGIFLIFN